MSSRREFFYGEGEGVFVANIAGEDDVNEAGVEGFIADGPDGNSGENLAKDLGLPDP